MWNFFVYIFLSQFFMVLSQFWKWLKTYFRRNFYKLYRNGANNISLQSYEKCETFSCWWFSLIPSCFQVISKTAGHSFCLYRETDSSKMHRVKNLNFSACVLELHSVFSRAFLSRSSSSTACSSPSTHRNWADDTPTETCCKHATFPCWSFFILNTILKVFHLKFIQCSWWTSWCFHIELLWHIFVCNFLTHLDRGTQMIFLLYKPLSQYFF